MTMPHDSSGAPGNSLLAPSSSIRIRPAVSSDLDDILQLLSAARLPVFGVAEGVVSPEAYVVADGDASVYGVAGIEMYCRTGLLRSVAVHPCRQTQGVGSALVRNRLDWAKARGLVELYLLTTRAEGYFHRFGFERIDRDFAPTEIQTSTEFHSLCRSSAAVMRVVLLSSTHM